MTMVTNPLTIGFWLWLAYRLGSVLLGEPVETSVSYSALPAQWLTSFAWPTLVGMAVFAFGSSFTAYLGVKLFWRLNVNLKRWRRRLSH